MKTNWPVLKRYEGAYLRRVALPVGGIGTGTVSLGGRGDLRDWEIVNRPAKGFTPRAFFALWAKAEGKEAVTRCLEGDIPPEDYEGGFGCALPNHSLPRFADCRFEAAYPFGQLHLTDATVPVTASLQAFNPMIVGNAEDSGLPLAVFRWMLTNKTNKQVEAAVCFSLANFIGQDGSNGKPLQNRNERRDGKLKGLFLSSNGVPADAEQWGTMAIATTSKRGLSHRTAWANYNWGDSLLDFWDDLSADGVLEEREASGVNDPTASLCAKIKLAPRASQDITFVLAWHFPNRKTWTGGRLDTVGNYYTTRFADAWDVIEKTAPRLEKLEAATLDWVDAFVQSDLPEVVKEAALFNTSTLRTQTCFRTIDGRFWGWEGCGDKNGCCHGSCTHVWNYEQATAFLFGELSRSMREIEFAQATREAGRMDFRVDLPLTAAPDWKLAAADGQMGCLMKLYRDWQLSGDDAMLRALWPKAKESLEFCWLPGGWDADKDGVMEGCQHNTMDVEYYGPNPQMGSWYIGALRAAEEMARYLGEGDFALTCRDLAERGSTWLDDHLFNGEYYEHEIRPPHHAEIAFGLRHDSMGAKNLDEPELQLGAGCLIDQLVGQYMSHVCGLGYLLKPKHINATLKSLMKYNFQRDLHGHFNHMRSYVLSGESAMLMATYPRGRRPQRPFPYCNEVMTGFEYTAAAHMLYEGKIEDGLKVIAAIRERYDGRKRSPFNEAECGHHYARAMASWAAVLALTGFEYSAVTATMKFNPVAKAATWFWSSGDAWGTILQQPRKKGYAVTFEVCGGTLKLQKLLVRDVGELYSDKPRILKAGQVLEEVIEY